MWPRSRLQSRAGKSVCKGGEYPLPLYVLSFMFENVHVGLITCCEAWPHVKSNAGSPDVERCKHVKSRATTVYFKLGKLRRVSTYVQHVWGIIGHVTAEAGNTVGTDGVPPHLDVINVFLSKRPQCLMPPKCFFFKYVFVCDLPEESIMVSYLNSGW